MKGLWKAVLFAVVMVTGFDLRYRNESIDNVPEFLLSALAVVLILAGLVAYVRHDFDRWGKP